MRQQRTQPFAVWVTSLPLNALSPHVAPAATCAIALAAAPRRRPSASVAAEEADLSLVLKAAEEFSCLQRLRAAKEKEGLYGDKGRIRYRGVSV